MTSLLDTYSSCTAYNLFDPLTTDDSTHLASFSISASISDLLNMVNDFIFHCQQSREPHFLMDKSAHKNICSESRLQNMVRQVKRITLPNVLPWFLFAGNLIHTTYGVYLAATITDINGHVHSFRNFAFVLLDATILFLFGLPD